MARRPWHKGRRCGNGILNRWEECDDGNKLPGDNCSPFCTYENCTWNFDDLSLPVNVWLGQAATGEIAFDGNCDLIVSGSEEIGLYEGYSQGIYRVAKDDGSVSVVVPAANLPAGTFNISGMTYRESDDTVYFFAETHDEAPNHLMALDGQDHLSIVTELDHHVTSLAVAPPSFGALADQLIMVSYAPNGLFAIDVESLEITTIAESTPRLSVATFGKDGTLYVADWDNDQVSTVTPNGVFTPFVTGLNAPDGMAVSPDGTRLFVAYLQDGGRIDQITIADQTLTPGILFELSRGFAATGMIVDGENHLLYETSAADHTVIDMFDAP